MAILLSTFFADLWQRLQLVDVILAVCFAVLGVAVAVLAKRITRAIRKKDEIADNDRLYVTIKSFSLILILVSFLILVFELII